MISQPHETLRRFRIVLLAEFEIDLMRALLLQHIDRLKSGMEHEPDNKADYVAEIARAEMFLNSVERTLREMKRKGRPKAPPAANDNAPTRR